MLDIDSIKNQIIEINGKDIEYFNIEDQSQEYRHIFICTGKNKIHLSVLCDKMKEFLKNNNYYITSIEKGDQWSLICSDDMIIHFLQQEKRDILRLEELFRV